MTRVSWTLRKKIVALGLLLLPLPNIAYLYFSDTQDYLLAGQRQSIAQTSGTIATMLHQRSTIFANDGQNLLDLRSRKNLPLNELAEPIELDAEFTDWDSQSTHWVSFAENEIIERTIPYDAKSLSFKHALGHYSGYIYAAFEVTDNQVMFRPQDNPGFNLNDLLLIAMRGKQGELKRFAVAPYGEGWVNTYLLDDNLLSYTQRSLETSIQGQWRITSSGYRVELRFPAAMLDGQIAIAIADIDEQNKSQFNYLIGTSAMTDVRQLSVLVNAIPELDQLLRSLSYADSRVWIIDQQRRVLAMQGKLHADTSLPLQAPRANWLEQLHNLLLPIYKKILGELNIPERDDAIVNKIINSPLVDLALSGSNGVISETTSDSNIQILVAAQPVYLNDDIVAAVLTEQSTINTERIVKESFEYQLTVTLLCMVIGTFVLLVFSDRIAKRVTHLRNQTESAIDKQGKIINLFTPSVSTDEIGDLSRTFSAVLNRLVQYNQYLENMAARLSHELRTPVAIVNSSLDNMELDAQHSQEYVGRAREGIQRLSRILQNMSEATRLEEIIRTSEIENFSIGKIVSACIDGYRMTYADASFEIELSEKQHTLSGSPDLFVQMLDKIISNAVEFSQTDAPIRIRTFEMTKQICLSISNKGPLLPVNMREQLVNSMVSIREQTKSSSTHLGLGLYIADMIAQYHNGAIAIDNLPDHSGVIVLVKFSKN